MSIAEQITQLKQDFDEIYNAGYEKGKAEGGDTTEAYNQGVADGKQAEYDTFWDSFQQNGERTNYRRAFIYWTEEPKPKYFTELSNSAGVDRTTNASEVFAMLGVKSNPTTSDPNNLLIDVSNVCKKFDFSECTTVDNLFLSARVRNIDVDLSGCTTITRAFSKGDYGDIDNITVTFSRNNVFDNTFAYTNTLTTITIRGDFVPIFSFVILAKVNFL